ncbi:hypothetical protein VTJ49DRAFT_5184 [Mycothermus thermophilus]|uniref:Uncharacterized protein n=1 Tax=Humicola insolens TaxID=85995 RepID=A0ABR3V531_HUMIN
MLLSTRIQVRRRNMYLAFKPPFSSIHLHGGLQARASTELVISRRWVSSSLVVYLENHRASGQRGDNLAVLLLQQTYLSRRYQCHDHTAELSRPIAHGEPRAALQAADRGSPALHISCLNTHMSPQSAVVNVSASGKAEEVGFGKTSHGTFHSKRKATGTVKWPLRTMSRFVLDSAF